jgi:hypothetical protein
MPPVYETLLLNTVVPQIQAAQAGDSYVMVVNATTPALRITQTGTGDSILVEDAANPDSSPFVVTAAGDVGIGTSSPTTKLHVSQSNAGNYASVILLSNSADAAADRTGIYGSAPPGNALPYRGGITFWPGAAGKMTFHTGNNAAPGDGQVMELSASGNLGLGVTPSAWGSGYRSMDVGSLASFFSDNNVTANVSANQYIDAGGRKYKTTNFATMYQQYNGQHQWYTAPSGTAGDPISFTQAMTLDASGNLGVGTTSPSALLDVNSGGVTAYASPAANFFRNHGAQAYSNLGGLQIYWNTSNGSGESEIVYGNLSTSYLRFIQNNAGSFTERARITSGGDFLVAKQAINNTVVGVENRADGSTFSTLSASVDATTTSHVYSTGAGAYRFYVGLGGTVYATNTTISAISDQRLKENIQDLDVGLSKLMALKPRKFDWKEGKGKNIKGDRGWIAQEFEQVFPDMIDEWKDPAPEGEEPYKSVRADLIPVLVKAIQEQQAMINELKAEVAALKGA